MILKGVGGERHESTKLELECLPKDGREVVQPEVPEHLEKRSLKVGKLEG